MNDELEEGEVAIETLETDIQDVFYPTFKKYSNI